MQSLIVDKNVLQGLSRDAWAALSADYDVMMADVLFFECLKSSPAKRAVCFGKLPPVDNPIALVHHVGHHLSFEVKHGRPLGRPSAHRVPLNYRFNAQLSVRDAALPASVHADIEQHVAQLRERVPEYVERIRTVYERIERVREASGSTRHEAVERMRAELLDLDEVRDFIGGFRDPEGREYLPSVDTLGEDSAIVVHFQVSYAMAVQRALDHGADVQSATFEARFHEALVHDLFDADYLVLGVLEGGFATYEKRLRRIFAWLRPRGTLWPPLEQPASSAALGSRATA